MGLEELFDDIRGLPPAKQAEVIDLVAHLRDRDEAEDEALMARLGRSGDAVLNEIDADPGMRARFNASLDRTQAEADAGDWVDGPTFMAEMREKSRRRLAGE
jgi:hypothetical protein